jgi:hypothetical protein
VNLENSSLMPLIYVDSAAIYIHHIYTDIIFDDEIIFKRYNYTTYTIYIYYASSDLCLYSIGSSL